MTEALVALTNIPNFSLLKPRLCECEPIAGETKKHRSELEGRGRAPSQFAANTLAFA